MMFTHVDHIGLAVQNLDEAVAFYEQSYGVTNWHRSSMPERHMEVAATFIGDTMIELIAPTSEEAAFAKYLNEKGPGMHHIAYRVDDIAASLEQLQQHGVRLIDETPRRGLHDTLVAFVHPKNANLGVLVELVQHIDGDAAAHGATDEPANCP
jgi:methylmalonyl-CoA/ethylmalonyl-CoA epimerase